MNDPQEIRHSFSQRYGYEPLPSPMQLEELSADLRRDIWNLIWYILHENREYDDSLYEKYSDKLYSNYFDNVQYILGHHLKISHDEISNDFSIICRRIKQIVDNSAFNELLDILEDFCYDDIQFASYIAGIFENHHAAYRLDTSKTPPQFIPRSSPEEGKATGQAIAVIEEDGFSGASTHLREAAKSINAGRFAQSVAHSIHAVESVARIIDQKEKTLGPALNTLEKAGLIKHPALKDAFSKLYGYTNDEPGIRHPLLDKDSADVEIDEAVFMFGACASFAAYLVNKHRTMSER